MKILYGVTGGVAAVITRVTIDMLRKSGHEVEIVTTEQGLYFFRPSDPKNAARGVKVWTDADEWPDVPYEKGAPVRHIALREWAEVMLIAPLTANTLAKIANGVADNLLTSVMRAWNLEKPVVVAPAMNTLMWQHPVTEVHLTTLAGWYKHFSVVQPTVKQLACGDVGMGALANINDIVSAVSCVPVLK